MATKQNRSERRSWDKYVRESKETYAEVDLGDEGVIKVYIPSSNDMEKLQSLSDTDQWGQIYALMGEENGEKLKRVAGDAPVTALRSLMTDVMADLGLSDYMGE